VKFSFCILPDVIIFILKFLLAFSPFYPVSKLTFIFLTVWNNHFSMPLLFPIFPSSDVYWWISLNLFSYSMFSALLPLSFIYYFIFLAIYFHNSVAVSLVILKLTGISKFIWWIFITPTYFMSISILINLPSS